MSVSLVVVRFEVADHCENIPDFSFKAPNYSTCADCVEQKLSYADVAGTNSIVRYSKEQIEVLRGRRSFVPVTIETFSTEEIELDIEAMDEQASGTEAALQDTREAEASQQNNQETNIITSDKEAHITQPDIESKHDDCAMTGKTEGKENTKPGQKAKGDLSSSLKNKSPSPIPILPHEDDPGGPSSRPNSAKGRAKGQLPITMRFFSGNPNVEITEGLIHLYKDNQMTSLTDDIPRSEMICMFSVPASMTSQDLLQFVGPVEPYLENLKIVRDASPNQYMVLLKFKSQKYADEFYTNYNNNPFNSIEPDICHLVYVAKIEAVKSSEGGPFAISGLTELPVCPVCLERMDESVDGILTILCNHSFHGSCLAQWGDTSCPVCRYVQTPEAVADNKCFECSAQESLWICLICGHVGCGRYVEGHAYSHFVESNHTYSMQLGNNRVWDYAGDNYVHRLVQNKGDGKLVQVDEGGNLVQEEKLDSITLEYTYLLTSQLESQRLYFEEKIERVETESLKQLEEVEVQSKKALEECTRLEEKLAYTSKEKLNCERRCTQMHGKMTKVLRELDEEKEMNKCLRQNQSQWQERVVNMEKKLDQKDKEVGELQEQLRDVMFYLEAQQKLSQTTEVSQQEIQEGQIVVSPSASSSGSGKKSHRKKGR